jgi:ribosomal subunit interface protein
MSLPLKIKTTGAVLLTDELRSFIEGKAGKLEKLVDARDTTALLEVEVESSSSSRLGGLYRAEINCTLKGGFVRAEARGDTLHAALDKATNEAWRELRHTKTKRRDLIRRGAAKVKRFFRKFGQS